MKYQFYAIIFDVAGNTTPVGSSASPAKSFVTNIQRVTGISINPSGSLTKNIGENFTISATVSPTDANNKTINWNSTNKAVATVDSNGKVTCLSAGTTTITATAADGSGVSANLELTVRNPINSLTLDKDQTTILKDGYTSTITATTDPANYDGANISWTIADTSIATVTVSGKTATIKSTSKIGQTTLTVSAGGLSKTVNVSVVNFVTTTYEYTGSVQQVDLPAGTYKFEVWGAQGGGISGGKGGYASGIKTFTSATILYIVVGGNGTSHNGYNGGGWGYTNSSYGGYGGGATHISSNSGLLKEVAVRNGIIIATGGGGGGGYTRTGSTWRSSIPGGNGGGANGENGASNNGASGHSSGGGMGATTSTAGTSTGSSTIHSIAGGAGYGGDGQNGNTSEDRPINGGGGGWFGGSSGWGGTAWTASGELGGGGGGSGYTIGLSSIETNQGVKTGDGSAKITPVN